MCCSTTVEIFRCSTTKYVVLLLLKYVVEYHKYTLNALTFKNLDFFCNILSIIHSSFSKAENSKAQNIELFLNFSLQTSNTIFLCNLRPQKVMALFADNQT